jgi:hypothetical protein
MSTKNRNQLNLSYSQINNSKINESDLIDFKGESRIIESDDTLEEVEE